MWAGKVSKKSPGAGVAMRGSVSVRGFDSSPFRPIWGPAGSIRTHFPILGVSPWARIIFHIISLFPPLNTGSETTSRLGNYGSTRKLRLLDSETTIDRLGNYGCQTDPRIGNYDQPTRKLRPLDSETTTSRLGNYDQLTRKLRC